MNDNREEGPDEDVLHGRPFSRSGARNGIEPSSLPNSTRTGANQHGEDREVLNRHPKGEHCDLTVGLEEILQTRARMRDDAGMSHLMRPQRGEFHCRVISALAVDLRTPRKMVKIPYREHETRNFGTFTSSTFGRMYTQRRTALHRPRTTPNFKFTPGSAVKTERG